MIVTILATFSLLSGERDGWVPVGKVPKPEETQEDVDPSIWVLFSKTIDLEKILVRFPKEPSYRNTESGDLEIWCEKGGEIFTLTVQKGSLPLSPDVLYESEGGWIHESIIQTEGHTYRFQAMTHQANSPHYLQFRSSFAVVE